MSVIVEFSIPAEEFALGRALAEAPMLSVEIDKMVPTGDETFPYFWVIGDERDRFDAVLEGEPEIREFEAVDELDTRTLYRAEWNLDADTFLRAMVEHDAVLQEAGGDADTWEFQLRFPDSHVLSEFHSACREAGVDLTVERLYNPIEPSIVDTRQMTEPQRDLIERAYDAGYFEVPRRTTLAELAEELGISDQSVNERLRRGLSALIEATLKSGASRQE